MITADRLAQAKKQAEQARRRKCLEENRMRESQRKMDDRRKYIIGELFCKHFPIALEIIPGRSSEEDRCNFECLERFLEALEKCQNCYRDIQNVLTPK